MGFWIQRLKLKPKRSVPDNWAWTGEGQSTKLSPSELRSHGKDVNHEVCNVCGKDVYFTSAMLRSDYVYKVSVKGKTKYACGYSHYLQIKGR
ncbi:MAG: hypothetical protein K0R46_1839 [Herbinix sp.]|jgi:hypothetical protein|nr:hypothetical protein [Herbinix sp.]